MNTAIRSERLKLRTLRSTWIAAAVGVVLSGIIGVAAVRISITNPPDDGHRLRVTDIALAPVQALWFLAILVAVLASAGEFQFRTIRTTLLLNPNRKNVLVAKSAVSGSFGGALVGVGIAAASLTGLITALFSHADLSSGSAADWAHVFAAIGLGVVWSVLATGLGILTRSTAIAVAAVLLWRFVGEAILPVLVGHAEAVGRWTPSGAGNALLGIGGPNVLPLWGAGLLFAGYALAVCGAAALLFTRADPS